MKSARVTWGTNPRIASHCGMFGWTGLGSRRAALLRIGYL